MDRNRQRQSMRALALLAGIAAWTGFLSQGKAFLCSRGVDLNNNRTGPSLAWFDPNITYSFNSAPLTKLDPDAARSAVNASFAVWQDANLRQGQSNCALLKEVPYATVLNFNQGPDTDQNFTGFNYLDMNNNLNVILFRESVWPHVDGQDGVIALTTTTFNHVTGEIFDADIEFNLANADIIFTTGDDSEDPNVLDADTDLMNTATHEIGHLIGFSHSDDANATMYSVALKGETHKRELACDDAIGLLFRYATADIGYCDGTNSGNCGDCQVSNGMSYQPNIEVQAVDRGLKRITCQNGATTAWPALLSLLLGYRYRRRMRHAVAAPKACLK